MNKEVNAENDVKEVRSIVVCRFCNNTFSSGPSVSRHRKICQEKIKMQTDHAKKISDVNEVFEKEKAGMKEAFEKEKAGMKEAFEKEKAGMKEAFEQVNNNLQKRIDNTINDDKEEQDDYDDLTDDAQD